MSPRILNWRSSKNLIFNEYLKTTMFRHYSNEVLDEMSNNQKKVDKQFVEVKQYVTEYVKTILNKLRSAGTKSEEFNEDRKNDSRSVDDLLQTPHGSKICEEISNEPINVKDELSRDMTSEKDDWCYAKKVRKRESAYIDKSMIDPLKYVIVRDIPQQAPQSSDCGMYACAFAEFINHGLFDISINMFNATNHRIRYGALLWDYARKKQNDGAISESEMTGNVTSKLGGPKILRDVVSPAITKKKSEIDRHLIFNVACRFNFVFELVE
ncbi:hypothetical protein BC332_08038 [Capsicum chinense]|nr:hypothetical protein BC332_08038 [Capsicum chinense]